MKQRINNGQVGLFIYFYLYRCGVCVVLLKEVKRVVVIVVLDMAASSSEKQVVLVAIDDSEHSKYALNWVLERLFPSPIFKLVLVHAKPSATSAVGLAGPGT